MRAYDVVPSMVGQAFGRLTVVERAPRVIGKTCRAAEWWCECECGARIKTRGSALRNGHAKSCGCLHRDITSKNAVQVHTTHGLSKHELYSTWKNMLHRCENDTDRWWKNYGGRGISVCERWHDVAAFIGDIERLIGARPDGCTLDRIDNDGNYEPANVRWASRSAQMKNTRTAKK